MLYLKDDEFSFIVSYMKTNYGVSLEKKRPLIEGRLSNHVLGLGFSNYMDYFNYAIKSKDNDEVISIINKLTTNHTFFLREKEHFDFYKETVLPWVDKDLKSKDLRVWSAGCSSGQEPYTLAMITRDYLGTDASHWDATLLASDISDKVLSIAKAGVYSEDELSKVPADWIRKYFTRVDESSFAVNDEIRRSVAFRNLNLLHPFQFKKPMHSIFCRNVMIYFDIPTKNSIIEKFYNVMLPGGYFFIGHSESLSSCTHKFKYIKPSIYQKEL